MLKVVNVVASGLRDGGGGNGLERFSRSDTLESQFIVVEGETPKVRIIIPTGCYYGGELLKEGSDAFHLGDIAGTPRFSCFDHISNAITDVSLRIQLSTQYQKVKIEDAK